MLWSWARYLVLVLMTAVPVCWAQPVPKVSFNHISITVPDDTFKVLAASQFLREEFAGFETRNTIVDGGDESFTGVYLYGERTYLEFIPASDWDPAGAIGFGMSVDDRALIPVLRERLERDLRAPVEMKARSRRIGDADVPWFDFISADWIPNSNLSLWTMGYYPDFFAAIHAPTLATTRENNLAPHYRNDRYMKNIKRVVLWRTENDINAMVKLFLSLGWELYADGSVLTIRDGAMEFVFVPLKQEESPHLEIDFDLNRNYHSVLSYGFLDGSELVFASRLARWSFPTLRKRDLPSKVAAIPKKTGLKK